MNIAVVSSWHWRLSIFVAIIFASAYHVVPISAFTPIPMTSCAPSDRRSIIQDIVSSTAAILVVCTIDKQPAQAVAPFAPIDTLLPAARVKITLDSAVDIAAKLVASKNDSIYLHDLESLLLLPQNYTRGTKPIEVPQQPAQSYLKSYAEYRNQISILEKPGAMLVQNGEIDTWKRLKRQERAKEDIDEVRAALNYYTSNINFDADKFQFTATKDERSKLIREDKVPDVKQVIASDMGLRYLLRNDILTACDDAKAELRYQMKLSSGDNAKQDEVVDGSDLLELLRTAQSACNEWFALIDEKDTLAALDVVRKERQ